MAALRRGEEKSDQPTAGLFKVIKNLFIRPKLDKPAVAGTAKNGTEIIKHKFTSLNITKDTKVIGPQNCILINPVFRTTPTPRLSVLNRKGVKLLQTDHSSSSSVRKDDLENQVVNGKMQKSRLPNLFSARAKMKATSSHRQQANGRANVKKNKEIGTPEKNIVTKTPDNRKSILNHDDSESAACEELKWSKDSDTETETDDFSSTTSETEDDTDYQKYISEIQPDDSKDDVFDPCEDNCPAKSVVSCVGIPLCNTFSEKQKSEQISERKTWKYACTYARTCKQTTKTGTEFLQWWKNHLEEPTSGRTTARVKCFLKDIYSYADDYHAVKQIINNYLSDEDELLLSYAKGIATHIQQQDSESPLQIKSWEHSWTVINAPDNMKMPWDSEYTDVVECGDKASQLRILEQTYIIIFYEEKQKKELTQPDLDPEDTAPLAEKTVGSVIGAVNVEGTGIGVAIGKYNVVAINSSVHLPQDFLATAEDHKCGSLQGIDREDWESLITKTKQDDSWLYPLPWDPTVRFEAEDCYVDLILETYRRGGFKKKEQKAELKDLFKPVLEGGARAKRVLLRGDAGYGKSTLCLQVVYLWAHQKTAIGDLPWNYTLPVLYKLRYLDIKENLEDILFSIIHSHYSPEELSEEQTRKALRRLGKNLLIILDGFDEIPIENQEKVIRLLKPQGNNALSLFRLASFLVTSRPTTNRDFLDLFENHFVICKLSDNKVQDFLTKISNRSTQEIEKFREYLKNLTPFKPFPGLQKRENLRLTDLSPLLIVLLFWIKTEGSTRPDLTNDDIIFNCIYLLSKRCNEREGYGLSDDAIWKVLHRLGLLCLGLNRPILYENSLREIFKTEQEYLFSLNIGFLKGLQREEQNVAVFEPLHKLFLDSLAQFCWKNIEKALEICADENSCQRFFREMLGGYGKFEVKFDIINNIEDDQTVDIYITCFKGLSSTVTFRFVCNKETNKIMLHRQNSSKTAEDIDCAFKFEVFKKTRVEYQDFLKPANFWLNSTNYEKLKLFLVGLTKETNRWPDEIMSISVYFADFKDSAVMNFLYPNQMSFCELFRKYFERLYSINLRIPGKKQKRKIFCKIMEAVFGISVDVPPRNQSATTYFKFFNDIILRHVQFYTVYIIADDQNYTQSGNFSDLPELKWKEISNVHIYMQDFRPVFGKKYKEVPI